LYWVHSLWLSAHNIQPDTSSDWFILFRSVAAVIFSFIMVLLFGGSVIRWLKKMKLGDRPEFHLATLNAMTANKADTPTMGGILIVSSIFITTVIFAQLNNFYVRMGLFCLVFLAVLGGVDDWLKLTSKRRNPGSRDGLIWWEKLIFQLGLGVLLALFIYYHGDYDQAHHLNWPFFPQNFVLPTALFAIIAVLVIAASSNAVNLTDGMDGLAAGCMVIVSFAFMALVYVTGDAKLSQDMHFNYIHFSSELTVLCGAIAGSCLGFIWFNCTPAQVFMGDTGSLALGGVIGYIAIVIRQEPMLVLVGGIFILELASVVIQVSYFKLTHGKKVFLCSPIHHHFHMKGWSEPQVVVRFWLLTALFAALALLTVKLR
jgi:phospho-N-acetylmuramoyl-pentapeptide-transferase